MIHTKGSWYRLGLMNQIEALQHPQADISVIVSTFGDEAWIDLALRRAFPSIERQTRRPQQVIHCHEATLQLSRNKGADLAETTFLIFLDADDELDDRYIESMANGSGDIRQPSTLGIVDGIEDEEAVLIPEKPLCDANYLVIGSMCRKDVFMDVGGFNDYPILEDWDLWQRMWKRGAVIKPCPEAIYRVHASPNSRNESSLHGHYYNIIRGKNCF